MGETWLSCSGIHPEAWTQVKPKPDKSTLRVNQRSLFFVILKAETCLFIKKITPFYKKNAYGLFIKKNQTSDITFYKKFNFLKKIETPELAITGQIQIWVTFSRDVKSPENKKRKRVSVLI